MTRTTDEAVRNLLGKDCDPSRNLRVFIDTASTKVDDLVQFAVDEGLTALTAVRLELIERWLSAHEYTRSDRIYTSNSTLRASGSYALGKNQTPYLDAAKELDTTGYLEELEEDTPSASTFWAGKPARDFTDYEDWE